MKAEHIEYFHYFAVVAVVVAFAAFAVTKGVVVAAILGQRTHSLMLLAAVGLQLLR